MYLKVPRSIGRFSLNIFGDLWEGGSLPLCCFESRVDILDYMDVEIEGMVIVSDGNLLGIIGNLLEEL